jgi:hypothetical protein
MEHDIEVDVLALPAGNRASNVAEPVHRVTVVQERDCDVQQWHICRVPSMGKKTCFAMQARIGRKCFQKLLLLIPTPTYFGILHVRSKNKDFEQFFYFCPNNITRCIKDTRCKWVKSRHDIPDVWLVQRGTNLTAHEIMTLEEVGF